MPQVHLTAFPACLSGGSNIGWSSRLIPGKAIAYSQKVLPLAERYVEHYLLTPGTNGVKNAIWSFVAGRKGRLFYGSERGAHASAGIYSLIETAKATGHEPYRYPCYLFDRLPRAKTPEAIDALLPYKSFPGTYYPNGLKLTLTIIRGNSR